MTDTLKAIIDGAENGNKKDLILIDQISNYGKKNGARWNQTTIAYCIMLQARSPRVYEFLRKIIHLPCKETLRSYTGRSTLETGVSSLVVKRLQTEAKTLNDIEKYGSLMLDEMTISPTETYVRNLQKYCGAVDMAGVVSVEDDDRLANKMLAFVLSGQTTPYRIPVAYFLVNQLTADQQTRLLVHVIEKVEEAGLKVFRVVADNLSTNVAMFANLNGGTHHHTVVHPVQPYTKDEIAKSHVILRPLFLSYDYCHVLKNLRNQFLSRKFEIEGEEISPKFAIKIYDLQQQELAKAVRNWTVKHVNPNSLEKQKVKPAMDMFKPDVTAAIRMHAEIGTLGFENVEPTVLFMESVHKWISIHDVSSLKEYWLKRLPDKRPFYDSNDERLNFLEREFPEKLDNWNKEVKKLVKSIPVGEKEMIKTEKLKFLTKETYHAVIFTSASTVACIRYLLDELHFKFVLTRRFSSDNIEQFFGAVRQMAGGNFKCDALAVSQIFEKILRTGIAES